jgi:hypothetical protein
LLLQASLWTTPSRAQWACVRVTGPAPSPPSSKPRPPPSASRCKPSCAPAGRGMMEGTLLPALLPQAAWPPHLLLAESCITWVSWPFFSLLGNFGCWEGLLSAPEYQPKICATAKEEKWRERASPARLGYVVAEWFTACRTCLTHRPVPMSVWGVGLIPARGTRYVASYKRDFRRGSRTGGFLRALRFFVHYQKCPIPPMSWVRAAPSLPCSPGGEEPEFHRETCGKKMLQNTKIQK